MVPRREVSERPETGEGTAAKRSGAGVGGKTPTGLEHGPPAGPVGEKRSSGVCRTTLILSPVAVTVPKLRRAIKNKAPGLGFETELWEAGYDLVVGIDEVGRGAWAGPISVGAAVVPKNRRVYKVRDSKMLTEDEREALFDRVTAWVDAWAVGHASHTECDELGMSEAQILATRRALDQLGVDPGYALVDGKWDFVKTLPTRRVVKGDVKSLSIAAASVLAKVSRDRLMRDVAEAYPGYNFENNKGYPCPHQKEALRTDGPSPVHRRSWAFMDSLVDDRFERYVRPDPQMSIFDA